MTKQTSNYLIGAICGILAAVCYGTNPLGAMRLYQEGVGTGTVLIYRFGIAAIILFAFMFLTRKRILPNRHEIAVTASLGVLFAISSLTLYLSFHRMDVGIASTLLFIYPIITSAIMVGIYGEKLHWPTVVSILLSLAGIAMLSIGGSDFQVDPFGVVLVLLSAISYAVYIVVVNRSTIKLPLGSMTAWTLVFCLACIICYAVYDGGLAAVCLPKNGHQWFYACFLALVPALLSLSLMAVSAKRIGSTPTAILGALEPLTAVCIGIFMFNEACTLRLALGIILILSAVILVLKK